LDLQVQQAGDDLQVIFHAVMHFLQQQFLFPQRGKQLAFGVLLPRDIGRHTNEALSLTCLVAHLGDRTMDGNRALCPASHD
jgi:hypothetical protein